MTKQSDASLAQLKKILEDVVVNHEYKPLNENIRARN
jgi:hypothetical protein